MTDREFGPVSNFSVTAWPSRGSTAFVQEVRPGEYGLVLRLGPVDMVIVQAPFPGGSVEFVRWCRHLSLVAGQVAAEVEQAARNVAMPRHYADEQPEQDGGTQEGDQGW
jgi:hypothetical protein